MDTSIEYAERHVKLEDVLHSQEGDEATDSDVHQRICIYLYNARARSCHIHVFRAPSRPARRRAV